MHPHQAPLQTYLCFPYIEMKKLCMVWWQRRYLTRRHNVHYHKCNNVGICHYSNLYRRLYFQVQLRRIIMISTHIRLISIKQIQLILKKKQHYVYFEWSFIHQHASSSNGFISIPFGFKAEIPYVIHVSFSRGFTQCVSLKLHSDNINLVSVLAHPTEK